MKASSLHRLVFMGSDPIALPVLEWVVREARDRVTLVGVFTQPDRPAGRGQKLAPNEIKAWALANGLPVLQPAKLGPDDLAALIALAPEAVLVMAYGHILRQIWLDAPPRGIWNLHTSILPRFRGAAPIQAAIAAGETATGVTLMRMVLRLDAGPVLDCECVDIDSHETGATLEEKLAAACVPLVARRIDDLFSASPALQPQNDALATFTRRLTKEDGCLDFSAHASVLARRINALFPWPGTFFSFGDEIMRVGLAEADTSPHGRSGGSTETHLTPGTVLAGDGTALTIAAGEGILRLLRLQRPGGRMLPAADFLRGRPIPVGALLDSASMPELIANTPRKG